MQSAQLVVLAASMGAAACVHAAEIPVTNPDLKVRWDNTLQYSAARRLKDPLPALVDAPRGINNSDDGDRNFAKGGLFLNRVDVLSEFDATYRDFGLRVSGAAWYDDAYMGRTASPATRPAFNGEPGTADRFGRGTRDLHGQRAEILDAFVFGAGTLSTMRGSFRLGRHTLLWGESLLFTSNGIASAQSPVDTVKAANKPGALAKELFMPVGQLSGQLEVNERLSFAGFYQFEWRRNRLNAAGSYFSVSDLYDANGERVFVPAPPGAPPVPFFFRRSDDVLGRDSGQFGISARYRFAAGPEAALYAVHFHNRSPQIGLAPAAVPSPASAGLQVGTYKLVYPEDVRLLGASVNTSLGNSNVGMEASTRFDAPLGSNAVILHADGSAPYPRGRTLHLQANVLHVFERSALWDTLSLAAEAAWNRVMSVTSNPAPTADGLPAGHTRDGLAIGMQLTPGWNNVLPQLNLSVPVTILYVPQGRGAALATRVFGGGDRTGQVTVALNGEYAARWSAGLAYTHFIGSGTVDAALSALPPQHFKDRDYVSFNVRTSF